MGIRHRKGSLTNRLNPFGRIPAALNEAAVDT